MTLERAVRVLNRERHHRQDDWILLDFDGGRVSSVLARIQFTAFEAIAIAIAKEYERLRAPSL